MLEEAKLRGLAEGFPNLVGAQIVAAAQGAPEVVASPENFIGFGQGLTGLAEGLPDRVVAPAGANVQEPPEVVA
jgi:hypothetical protein